MRFGVKVTFPISARLAPRLQVMNNEPFYYEDMEEAQKWCDFCSSDPHTTHNYEVACDMATAMVLLGSQ